MVPENLKRFYIELERDQRVSARDIKVRDVQQGVERIVQDILHHVERDDKRFKLKRVDTGSFYDEAKVGEPDEFDYVAEIEGLSRHPDVQFVRIPDPVFLQVKLSSMSLRQTWRDFLSDPVELRRANSHSMSHVDDTSNTESSPIDLQNPDLILNPVKVQKRFRGMVDRAFGKIQLPPGWEYGGCNRPHFSGIRRHGPATMLQLVYRTPTDEYKVNVDLTIGIALPLPVKPEDIGMNVLERIPGDSVIYQIIQSCLEYGPCLHVIPLYSNLLVSKKRYENKFSWRVSCSGIEKCVFDLYPETSGVKICMRMIKAIRELFLAEDRRKTHRQKKKKRKPNQQTNGRQQNGPRRHVRRTHGLGMFDLGNLRNDLADLGIDEDDDEFGLTRQAPFQASRNRPLFTATNAFEAHETDTTDLTEMENESQATSEESKRRIRFLQIRDVSEMNPSPGTGEYYGPRTYMPSIEIKCFIFNMITLHPEASHWTMDTVCQYAMDFYTFYYQLLKEKKYVKHYFFDTIVSSPCKDEQAALLKIDHMFRLKQRVLNGELAYQEVKELFKLKSTKQNAPPRIEGIQGALCPLFRFSASNVCVRINDFISSNPTYNIY